MDQLVRIACDMVGTDPARVVKSRVTDAAVILIVDNGIKGCPKYTVPRPLAVARPAPVEVLATTEALAYAKMHGVDMTTLQGTGRGRRILVRDVRKAIE